MYEEHSVSCLALVLSVVVNNNATSVYGKVGQHKTKNIVVSKQTCLRINPQAAVFQSYSKF